MNGRTYNISRSLFIALVILGLLLCSTEAFSAIDNSGLMDRVLNRFKSNASGWGSVIEAVATRLFWTLVVISMVWTFGMMALSKADIGEFFAEFLRFTIFTGFFWWLLVNGPSFALSIIESLMQLGGTAAGAGYSDEFTPSGIIDIGFVIFGKTIEESSRWSPFDSVMGMLLGLAVLFLCALIAINMLMLLISAWIMAYAGIFFLGFGGSRWTHDLAINYYKAVLGLAIQIMTMILLVGIGVGLVNEYYLNMQTGVVFSEMAVIAMATLTIYLLCSKVPQLLAEIVTGMASGGGGIGQFGAGALMGAGATAVGAATMAGSMIASGATQASGGASALMAAFKLASEDAGSGGDILAGNGGDSGSGGGGDSDGAGTPSGGGATPFAKAAGISSGGGGGSNS
jgi:P-type conjugative transfer protein TrbL